MTSSADDGGLVTLGETMALFATDEIGPLRSARSLRLSVAGAESNVAIGMRRLGVRTTWISRLGADDLGDLVESVLRGEEVEVRCRRDRDRPTGLMIKARRTATTARVLYYRTGSAASALSPDDVVEEVVARAGVLHLSGITPALSPSCAAAVDAAVDVARRHGVPVSFDVNFRRALWSPEQAVPVLRGLAARADILFAGTDEAALLLGEEGRPDEAAARELSGLGPPEVVLKRGAAGALAVVGGELLEQPGIPVAAVDHVGAGDAFVAGYLAAHLRGAGVAERLQQANRTGAFAVTVSGDWEGAPTTAELGLLAQPDGTVLR